MDPTLETDEDTLGLAQAVRESQGSFEMEVTCGDEADLHRSYTNCPKNPGHDKFVPVGGFSLDYLPAQYQDPDIVELVNAHAALTVLVRVKCISDKRPDIHPSTGKPYPFIKFRGRTDIGRTGTGFINLVCNFKNSENRFCECVTCITTGHRQKAWGDVFIDTAAHVVFDKQECDQTKCLLFYDTSGAKLSDLPTLDRLGCVKTDVKADKITMRYITHDMELIDKLNKMKSHYYELSETVYDKYNKASSPDVSSNTDAEHKLTIIVSHPHGCSKMITVGDWTDYQEHGPTITEYIYNTATCHGSSGAFVYILGRARTEYDKHLHRGSCVTPGLNCSGTAVEDTVHTRQYSITVPYSKLHLVFGTGRKKLKEIKKRANVHITIEQGLWDEHSDLPTTPDCELTINGLPNNARRAKTMVEAIMEQNDDSIDILTDLSRVEEIVIPASKVHLIFSQYGVRLKRLKKYVGMYVIGDVNAAPATDVKLCIFGDAPHIQRTKQVVEGLLAERDDLESDSDSDCEIKILSVDKISDAEDISDEENGTEKEQTIEREQTAEKAVAWKVTSDAGKKKEGGDVGVSV